MRLPRLAVRSVSKSFPGVRALSGVSLEVAPGEVHAVVGENGAGKSTLVKIVAGVLDPDTGDVAIDGESLGRLDERGAGQRGIGMVHQEGSLVPNLSVAESIFAGRVPTRALGLVDWATMRRQTAELLRELHLDVDPATPVGRLSSAQRQMAEIAKALSLDLAVLILDEPTAALTMAETDHLFKVIEDLAARDIAVVYISHRLAEIFTVADRVTVLRDGAVTGCHAVGDIDEDGLMELMVGRQLSFERDGRRVPADAPALLEVADVTAPPEVASASLTIRRGEIVCLAGLIGAGRTELSEALFGARPYRAARFDIDGEPAQIASPADAIRHGLALVPEDRKRAGLFLDMGVDDNVIASNLAMVSERGLVSQRSGQQLARRYVDRLRIATPSLSQRMRNLSGGNQQKTLLAKWLAGTPRVLIVDEPTRGVDVGARAEIYKLLRGLAEEGMGLLLVSSDLTEVLTLAHRIVVMSEGRTVGELDGADATELDILRLASVHAGNERGTPAGDAPGPGVADATDLQRGARPADLHESER